MAGHSGHVTAQRVKSLPPRTGPGRSRGAVASDSILCEPIVRFEVQMTPGVRGGRGDLGGQHGEEWAAPAMGAAQDAGDTVSHSTATETSVS